MRLANWQNWLLHVTPQRLHKWLLLMRADRPVGSWLLLLPCWQGMMLAVAMGQEVAIADLPHILWLALLFFIGAILLRGAGCVLNDIVDRDLDAKVERTRDRPLPSGQVSVFAASIFGLLLSLLGLFVLLSLNRYAQLWCLIVVPVVAIYPLMKRITYWPQLFLGIAFNSGVIIGWVAYAEQLFPSLACWFFYMGAVVWTVGYDSIYALQDVEDDQLIGIKSTAVLFGANTVIYLAGIYSISLLFTMVAGYIAGLGLLYWIFVALYGGHLLWQIWCLRDGRYKDRDLCRHIFSSNVQAGSILLVGLLLSAVRY